MSTVGKKLLWGIGLPAVLVAVGGVGFYWAETLRATREAVQEEAQAIAELVDQTFTLAQPQADASNVHRPVSEAIHSDLEIFRSISKLRVIDTTGRVVWSRSKEEEGTTLGEAQRLLQTQTNTINVEDGRFFAGPSGAQPVEVIRPLSGPSCTSCHAHADKNPVGILHLAIDSTSLQHTLGKMFERVLASVLVFALVLGIATALSLRVFISRPLTRLITVMRRAEQGDILVRADVRRGDEFGDLAQAFNRMLAAITSMKAEEIEHHRDLEQAQAQIVLKQALEKTNAELNGRITELATLYDIAGHLSSTLSLQELLDRITYLVPERLQIPQFSIMLLNHGGKLEIRSAHPPLSDGGDTTFEIGEGVCGRAAETMKSWYVGDAEADRDLYRIRSITAPSKGSLLSVPMIHGGKLLGVLNFERPEKAAFSASDIEFLRAVADQAALAVKNAQLHEQTVELSITDPLTGIPNRRHLFSRLELEIARANRFGTELSLLMIDIDHFKKLNDAAGHRAGDEVLRTVSHLVRGMIRKVDTVARYGGEEFIVILPQVSKAESLEVAEKLRRCVAETLVGYGTTQPNGTITISIGVSNLPADASSQDQLLDCADAALYASKRGGRNLVTGYEPGMEQHPGRERGLQATADRIPLPGPSLSVQSNSK